MSHVRHLVLPGYETARNDVVVGESISAFLERNEWDFQLPTICVMNGTPILRKAWATTAISDPDEVVFYSKPYGGNNGTGKALQVAGIVALIAIAAFAPWAAVNIAGFAQGTFGFYAVSAAITVGGGLLVSTFLSPKAATNGDGEISQIYSLSAAGNTANPFQVIPVQYGRLKFLPSYASLPWTEFIGNDSYLNVLLANGQGKYFKEQLLIDDTVLWDSDTGLSASFTDVTWQFCDPGEPFTLFPANVINASEVSGQEITDVPLGMYTINDPDTVLTDVAFDLVFPAGLRGTADDGGHFDASVTLTLKVQQIDNVGAPIGGPFTVVAGHVITMNTPQPQRVSLKYNLVALGLVNGRYQASIERHPTTAPDQNTYTDLVSWAGLRGYLQGSNTYENCSVTGIRIKATAQLSQNAAKNFAIIQTRILPVWNGVDDMVEEPTQNAFWAFYDAAVNQNYGAKWPVNKVDFQTIVDMAAAADTRGDAFNYRFDSPITFQSAFDRILQSNRSKVTWLGDVLSCTRDEWQAVPDMLLSDQQIIRGSMEVDFVMNSEDSSDCVQGQFLNENTWQPAMLQYPKNSEFFTAQSPSSMQIEGITNPDQLFEELRFFWKQAQLRRIKIRLDTEHDGRLLRFGSAVKVQSFLPRKWGASGEVVSYNSGTRIVTINRTDLDTVEAGQHYIEFRAKTGAYFGPIKCTFGLQPNKIELDAADLADVETDLDMTIAEAFDRMDGAEPPSFVWGLSSMLSRHCIVLSGKPTGHKVSLDLVVDSEAVHDVTGDDIPPLPTPPPYADPRAPVITGLVASLRQGIAEPVLAATWWPAKGAIYYKAQVSYDGGTSWTTIADALQDANLNVVAAFADLRLRVAGVGYLQGPWSFVDVAAPNISSPTDTGPEDLTAGLHDYIMNRMKLSIEQLQLVVQQIAAVAAETDAAATTNSQVLRVASVRGFAQVAELTTVFADFETSFASYQVTVEAHFDDTDASVTAVATAVAGVDDFVAAMYSLTLDVDGYVTGFSSTNNGTTSLFQVVADKFVVAKPGVSGGAAIAVFEIGTHNGVASIGVSGNLYLDGTITANFIAANAIQTVHLSATSVTAAKMAVGSITAANAALDALAVKTLNIQGNAVTVPQVTSFSGNTSGSLATLCSFNMSIDTTGISGATITIYAIACLAGAGASNPASAGLNSTLTINGSTVSQLGGGTHSDVMVNSGAIQVTATGGVMSISVVFQCGGMIVTSSATLYAIAAKR